jgi:chemotaxis protein methyltransferase CheR
MGQLLQGSPSRIGDNHEPVLMAQDLPQNSALERYPIAHAFMATAREPFVILDKNLRVVAANRSYRKMFPPQIAAAQDHAFREPDSLAWDISALRPLQDAMLRNAVIEDYEVELDVPDIGRRSMLLNARQADHGGADAAMLVSLEDVTARREAQSLQDALLRQQEMLLLEVHHRVANSLQIIASILLLKARAVQSEETRRHLNDIHKRLILVATVQRQLCTFGAVDAIEFGPYLAQLCKSLASSMVAEDDTVAIVTSSTGGTIRSDDAVNFGLIVTELVVNALKHGFPDGRKGRIAVDFAAEGSNWRLSVSDNGVGRRLGPADRGHDGLGTSIVEALARHLKASVEISPGRPGATTTIVHAGHGRNES